MGVSRGSELGVRSGEPTTLLALWIGWRARKYTESGGVLLWDTDLGLFQFRQQFRADNDTDMRNHVWETLAPLGATDGAIKPSTRPIPSGITVTQVGAVRPEVAAIETLFRDMRDDPAIRPLEQVRLLYENEWHNAIRAMVDGPAYLSEIELRIESLIDANVMSFAGIGSIDDSNLVDRWLGFMG